MFMLGNSEYLLFGQATHANAVSERDHVPNLGETLSNTSDKRVILPWAGDCLSDPEGQLDRSLLPRRRSSQRKTVRKLSRRVPTGNQSRLVRPRESVDARGR